EAAVAGRAVVMAEPAPPPAELRADWYDRAPAARDAAAFEAACLQAAPADTAAPGAWGRERPLAHGDPPRRPAPYLAPAARRAAPSPPPAPEALLPPRRPAWFPYLRAAYLGGRGIWTQALGAIAPARAHDAQEADDFSASEVDARTRAWALTLDGARRARTA